MPEPTAPNEPLEVLVRAALEALWPCEKALRERGWDANKVMHDDGGGSLRVCLEITLQVRVPIENARE